jgi:murein DD-endopeptidase MepM/ murein hydrolase activator NlpD/beta-lactamase regulating signal transducer with metallopeptidase domain
MMLALVELLCRTVFWAVVHSLWQGLMLCGAAAMVRSIAGPQRPKLAHRAALLSLAALVVLPLLTALDRGGSAAHSAPPSAPWWKTEPLILAVAALWFAGATLSLCRLAGGAWRVRTLLSRAAPLGEPWRERFGVLAERAGVRRVPRLLESASAAVPMTAGFLKPAVCLPVGLATSLPVHDVEMILLHELAHVAASDFAANLVQSVAETALFYHPGAWWLGRAIRADREHRCDAAVLSAGHDRRSYARALLRLELNRATPGEPALAINGGTLMRRVRRVLGDSEALAPRFAAAVVGLALMAAPFGVLWWAGGASAALPQGDSLGVAWLPPAVAVHEKAIAEAARRHGLDPALVALVVLVESGGDAAAQSPIGAAGLMQLMPKTAALEARERGLSFSPEKLMDVETNLDLGAAYLARQLAHFRRPGGDDVSLAAAAYNAGPERVDAYLAAGAQLPEESVRYAGLVAGMYQERAESRSTAFQSWRDRARQAAARALVAPVVGSLSFAFGEQLNPFSKKPYPHSGVDVAAATGTPVVAPLDGHVREVTQDPERGNVIVVRHARGIETVYQHLESVSVRAGDAVKQGAEIGTVGTTGRVTGPHLHFEVRDLGEPIDPAAIGATWR